MIQITGSIVGVLGRLFQSLVIYHLVLESHQDILNGRCVFPGLEQTQVFNAAVGLVNRGDVNLVTEADGGSFFWIFRSADKLQAVDSILEIRLNGQGGTLYGPRMVAFQ